VNKVAVLRWIMENSILKSLAKVNAKLLQNQHGHGEMHAPLLVMDFVETAAKNAIGLGLMMGLLVIKMLIADARHKILNHLQKITFMVEVHVQLFMMVSVVTNALLTVSGLGQLDLTGKIKMLTADVSQYQMK
jgi:hypothetical protein